MTDQFFGALMKRLIAAFLSISFSITSTARADVVDNTPPVSDAIPATEEVQEATITTTPAEETTTPAATTPEESTEEVPEGKVVGKASEEASHSASRERWTNVAIAAGAVVVATVCLVLVSQNKGRTSGN